MRTIDTSIHNVTKITVENAVLSACGVHVTTVRAYQDVDETDTPALRLTLFGGTERPIAVAPPPKIEDTLDLESYRWLGDRCRATLAFGPATSGLLTALVAEIAKVGQSS